MKEIVFPKKKQQQKKQSLFHFPLTGAAMVQLASSDKWKMPSWEQYWKSTWTKQPETASCMCHSFGPFNHELSCNSLNNPWHQTKVSVFYINTYIYTLKYSKKKMPRIRSCIFWSLAKQILLVWSTYWKFRLNRFLIRFLKFLWRRILLLRFIQEIAIYRICPHNRHLFTKNLTKLGCCWILHYIFSTVI